MFSLPSVEVVGHEVDEVERLGEHGHVVGHVDDVLARAHGRGQHEAVRLERGPHLAQQLAEVVLVHTGEAGAVVATACEEGCDYSVMIIYEPGEQVGPEPRDISILFSMNNSSEHNMHTDGNL